MIVLGLAIIFGQGWLTHGQVTANGTCPMIQTQPAFNAQAYIGRWFEYAKIPSAFEQNQVCIMADYYPNLAQNNIVVRNRGYDLTQRRYVSITGDAIVNPSNPGQLGIRFFPNQPRQPYNVLATDYRTFSLVFSCLPGGDATNPTSQQFLWILTRDRRGVPAHVVQMLLAQAQRFGIDVSNVTPTQQIGCPNYRS